MIRILPGGLITNNKHVQWQFKFVHLLIHLAIVGLDIDTVWAPVFAVLVFVACEEHDAFLFGGEDCLEDLLGVL